MTYEIKTLALSAIRTNGGTQTRVGLNAPAVREYGEAMTEGAKLPPVTVFFDGTDHWLADGFHRVQASMDIGALSIEAEIRPGNQRDARLYSAGANGSHGVQRTNEDKRRAVQTLLADAEWAKWSDREIARQCNVAHSFVAKVRGEAPHLDSNPDSAPTDSGEKTVARGGKTYTQKTSGVAESNKKRGKQADPSDTESPTKTEGCNPIAPTEANSSLDSESSEKATPPDETAKQPGPVKASKPEEPGEVDRLRADLEAAGEFVAEQGANLQTLLDEVIELRKVCEADDKLAAAAAVIKQKTAENRVLREQLNGAMATTAEAQRAAKSWRAKHDKLAKEIERARSV